MPGLQPSGDLFAADLGLRPRSVYLAPSALSEAGAAETQVQMPDSRSRRRIELHYVDADSAARSLRFRSSPQR
jgi:hypothetical protein